MVRVWMVALVLAVALQGSAYGQGFLDSILGPGGLGVWGSPQGQPPIANQFNSPQFYRGSQDPNAPYYQQPAPPSQQPSMTYSQPAAPQEYNYSQPAAPQQYGYPNQGYVSQPGVYSDWQNYQPTQPGAPPPVRYSAPPPQASAPAPAPAASTGPPLRPGQYSPNQGQPMEEDVDRLPPGALRVTTTTPEGTIVQYYPPAGEGAPQQTVAAPSRPRPARRAAPPRRKAPETQTAEASGSPAASPTGQIAMPKPVEIPSGRDPRSGWGLR